MPVISTVAAFNHTLANFAAEEYTFGEHLAKGLWRSPNALWPTVRSTTMNDSTFRDSAPVPVQRQGKIRSYPVADNSNDEAVRPRDPAVG